MSKKVNMWSFFLITFIFFYFFYSYVHFYIDKKHEHLLSVSAGLSHDQTHFSTVAFAQSRGKQHVRTPGEHNHPHPPLSVPETVHIAHVPEIDQLPQLKNGCEVTSLAMLLRYAGFSVSKMTLAAQIKRDRAPLVGTPTHILSWGDPNIGFVGSMSGRSIGYGVYHGPIFALAQRYFRMRKKKNEYAVDLTGEPFSVLEHYLSQDRPVEVITNSHFIPESQATGFWVTYRGPRGEKVTINWDEHAVLLVGYSPSDVFINNPLTGQSDEAVPKEDFIEAWVQMGSQAISYTAPSAKTNT